MHYNDLYIFRDDSSWTAINPPVASSEKSRQTLEHILGHPSVAETLFEGVFLKNEKYPNIYASYWN